MLTDVRRPDDSLHFDLIEFFKLITARRGRMVFKEFRLYGWPEVKQNYIKPNLRKDAQGLVELSKCCESVLLDSNNFGEHGTTIILPKKCALTNLDMDASIIYCRLTETSPHSLTKSLRLDKKLH